MSRMLYPGMPPSKSVSSGTRSSPRSAKAGEGVSGIQNEQPRFEVTQDVVDLVLYEGVMFRVVWCRLPAILSLLVLSFTVDVTTQSSRAEELQAGITRSEVTLDFRTVAVSVPALPVGGATFRTVVPEEAGTPSELVRVARLDVYAAMAISTVELADALVSVSRYDLWLVGTGINAADDDWSLVVASALGRVASAPADVVGTLRLAHRTRDVISSTLTGGIVAAGNDGGRLMLSWGRHEWTTGVRFTMQSQSPRARRPSGGGDDRTFDFTPTDLQRIVRLGSRNTVSVTLPDGSRVATVYPKNLNVEDRDYAQLVSVATDAVVRVTAGAVIRLDTDIPLEFGDVTLETGNVGLPDSPGAYGVWLKRVADGWRLVFNDEPDAWGTQRDPVFDVAEVRLEYSQARAADDSFRAMSASVVMTTAERGWFVLVWGPHEWTADFTVAR